jgi:class 3 adenylate cyclase
MVTVLFSDIRGFTSISERLQPEQVAEMLREYLSEMTEIVFKHGGTVDKYIGDCVMALYNVPFADPDHAVHAVRTALEFQERTLAVSARWQERLGVSLRSGVGINTGEAIVGAMGSRQRLEYTAIGDTVNLASRLETATKDYAASIIISEYTRSQLRGDFLVRELGDVTVKGKSRPVKIYAVLPGDTRRYPRAALEVEAVITRGDGQTSAVGTHDVSEGGVALSGVPDELAQGETVEIRCESGLLAKPLVARGTIAWRRGDQAGLTFSVVDADSARALAEYIIARRAAPPA